jgi:hypothetical protein
MVMQKHPSKDETFLYSRLPRCPRCGYNQRGVIVTWREHCPLHGKCSECGLDFNWAELLMPEKFEPRWCVEFARETIHLPAAAIHTACRSCRAWRFWSAIRMAYPVRPRRIAAYIMLLLAALLVVYLVQRSALAYRVWAAFNNQVASTAASAQSSPSQSINKKLSDLQQQVAQLENQLQSFRSMQARHSVPEGFDVEQACLYIEATIDSIKTEIARLQIQLQSTAATPPPALPQVPFAREWWRAIVTPWSNSAGPIVMIGTQSLLYPAPSTLWQAPGVPSITTIGAALRHGGWTFWLTVLSIPACFVLLPMSRKRAKVRWPHVGRAFAYSLIIPMTACVASGLLCSLALAVPGFRPLNEVIVSVSTWGVAIGIVIWWAAAIRRYLFIPHPWGISLLLCFLSLLLGFTIELYAHLQRQYGVTFSEVWSNVVRPLE